PGSRSACSTPRATRTGSSGCSPTPSGRAACGRTPPRCPASGGARPSSSTGSPRGTRRPSRAPGSTRVRPEARRAAAGALEDLLVFEVTRVRPSDERHARNLSVQDCEALAELHGKRHLHLVALTLEDLGEGDHHLLDKPGVGVDAQLLRDEALFMVLL